MSVSGAVAVVSPWAPLRRPTFRILWLAQAGSNVGTWMQTVAAQWILVGHGPTLVSLVQTASMVPTLFLALPAGVLADTVDRRRLLYVTMTLTAGVVALLAVITASGAIRPGVLLAFTFVVGCGAALTGPAWQAVQPELVPREEIPEAAGLGSVAINAARAVGPALGGFLVAWVGPALVFAINAASFLGIAAAVFRWRRPRRNGHDPERMWPAMRSGLRYVQSAPGVRRVMLRSALFAVPASGLWALLPVTAREHFHLSSSGYGLLLGVLGVGAIAGVAVLPRLRTRLSTNAVLALSSLAYAIGVIAAAYLSLGAAIVLLALAGAAWIGTLSSLNSAMQLTVAGWVRARGMAVYLLVFIGSQAVGSFGWGLLAQAVGTASTLAVTAGLLVVVAVSVRFVPLLAGTGTLDRTPALDWPTPTLVFDPDPSDGPVLVTTAYRVSAENLTAFVAAMGAVGRSRRRTGASRWRLYQDGSDPERLVEFFVVPSWGEHLRQHRERWTGADRSFHEAAMALTTGPPVVEHLLPPHLGGG